MTDPFVAEIRLFGFNFAPSGWAFCNGQILPISQNTALFSLLGTTYGGNGKSDFALPNLQGRAPLQIGQGPGLQARRLGEQGGVETVTLNLAQIPAHTHQVPAQSGSATSAAPAGGNLATAASGRMAYAPGQPNTALSVNSLSSTGAGMPHNNLQPYLTLNFCIALQGVFPPRS